METHVEKCSQHNSQFPVYLIIPHLVLHKNLTSFLYLIPVWKANSVKLPYLEIQEHASHPTPQPHPQKENLFDDKLTILA